MIWICRTKILSLLIKKGANMNKTHCDICENVINPDVTYFLIYGYRESLKEAAILNMCVCAHCIALFNINKAFKKFKEIRIVKTKFNHHTTVQKEYAELFTKNK